MENILGIFKIIEEAASVNCNLPNNPLTNEPHFEVGIPNLQKRIQGMEYNGYLKERLGEDYDLYYNLYQAQKNEDFEKCTELLKEIEKRPRQDFSLTITVNILPTKHHD